MVFGVLYGEFFGPTGVLPVLWLSPLDEPVQLLVAGIGLGAVLLAGRLRPGHGQPVARGRLAAGAVRVVRAGRRRAVPRRSGWSRPAGTGTSPGCCGPASPSRSLSLALTFVGTARRGRAAGARPCCRPAIELFDIVVRLGSNLVSFARLAAFGLTHAALGLVVWRAPRPRCGAAACWRRLAAVLVFLVGNAVTFALEALVAGVQALRLEYYELFSRVFQGEGRPFRPWHVPVTEGAAP